MQTQKPNVVFYDPQLPKLRFVPLEPIKSHDEAFSTCFPVISQGVAEKLRQNRPVVILPK